jgi:membrane protease subunit HflK
VRDAFDDVLRARQDKETLINQAEAYRQDIIPKAEGESVRIIRAAEGFQQQKIAEATGNARQFLAVLREYEKSKDVTRRRLYLEAMEDILPGISKFVVSPEAQGAIILNAGGGVVPIPQLSPTTTQPLPTTPTPSDGQ